MRVNFHAAWQSKRPNLSSHPRKYHQQDYFPENRRGATLPISRARPPARRLSLKKRRGILLFKPRESDSTSAFQKSRTTLSKASDKVKMREPRHSHYIAVTEKGKGTALPLVDKKFYIYRPSSSTDGQTCKKMLNPSSLPRVTLPAKPQQSSLKMLGSLPPENTSANKSHQSKSISYQ